MALRPWSQLSSSVVKKNPWWTYRLDAFKLPDGKEGEYHYVHTNGSSLVVPVFDDGLILLVRQYRYLARRESVEFPCGSVNTGSTYDETAEHELVEETGYRAAVMTPSGSFNPYNGVTDEFCRVYLARGLQFVGGTPDATEEFELVQATADEIDTWVTDGSLWDGMTIAAWCLVRGSLKG